MNVFRKLDVRVRTLLGGIALCAAGVAILCGPAVVALMCQVRWSRVAGLYLIVVGVQFLCMWMAQVIGLRARLSALRKLDWRDALLVAGAAIFAVGLAKIFLPAALIVGGAALVWFAVYGKQGS